MGVCVWQSNSVSISKTVDCAGGGTAYDYARAAVSARGSAASELESALDSGRPSGTDESATDSVSTGNIPRCGQGLRLCGMPLRSLAGSFQISLEILELIFIALQPV